MLAFIVGALLMIISDSEVRSKFAYFFARPSDALIASWDKVSTTYAALIKGAIGGYGPISETTAQAAPLICAGLGGFGLSCGTFQYRCSGSGHPRRDRGCIHRSRGICHLAYISCHPGALGGAFWGGIVGWLKAKTGAHEVIVTIMMNYIALGLLAYLPHHARLQRPGRTDPISPSTGTPPCHD